MSAKTDPEARRLAAQALADDASDEAPKSLSIALADTDWRVRKEAAQSAALSPRRAEVLRELLAALGDRNDVGLRNSAVEALVAIGPDAVPTAIAALRTLDADGRKLAVEVLGGVPDVRSAEALASALSDEDPNVRQSAAEALGTSAMGGDDARKTAVRALKSVLPRAEPMMKLAVLGALSRIGVAHDWNVLAPLTHDPMLRTEALAAAARCADPNAGLALVDALFDANVAHARTALGALAEWIEAAMRQALPISEVAGRLQAKQAAERAREIAEADPDSRGAALTVLALLGDAEAAPAIVRGLLDPMLARSAETAVSLLGAAALPALLAVGEREPPSRHAALLLVVPTLTSRLDDRSITIIRATLGNESDDVAAAAAQVLGALGDGEDIERLAILASSDRGRAPLSAALAIEQLAQRHPDDALAAFGRLSNDPAKIVAGCVLLTALRGGPPASTEYLRRALGAGEARTRRAAIEAFAAIGGEDARETVATALADEDRDVQLAAIRALGALRHAEPLSVLIDSLSDPEIVAAAASALSEADGERALEVCTRLVAREDPAIASAAVAALGRLGERAETGLARALDHPSDEVVKLALSELGRAPSPGALALIGHSLDHASWEVRRVAAEVLGAEGSDDALTLLRARLERESDATVREAIMLALAGPWSSPASGAPGSGGAESA